MPLNLFYTMVQNSQKWPKTQIKRVGKARSEAPYGVRPFGTGGGCLLRKNRELSHG